MLGLRPDEMLQEMIGYHRKLAEGFKTVADLGAIDVGATPKGEVYREDKLVLYRYKALVDRPASVPLLVVYALVNRPYMADLQKDRSMIRGLLEQGIDVYLIDWGYPDGADRFLELDDYVNRYIHHCVKHICKAHTLDKINILGICQGGTMSVCYTALHPQRVANLVTMVTPIDFKTPDNALSKLARDLDVDLLVDAVGNIPGELLNFTFLSMQPFRLTGQKYADVVNLMDDARALKNFMRMEKWIFDSPDQAGEMFRQFIKWFYQENRLIEGNLEIAGRPVDLTEVSMPVFNIYGTTDHLVPPDASIALGRKVGSKDYSEYPFKGGHIGIYVSGRAQREVPPAIAAWLKERM